MVHTRTLSNSARSSVKTSPGAPPPDLCLIICYACFNFGMSMSMMYVMTFIMPQHVEYMVGSQYAPGVLGLMIGIASIGNAFVTIAVGVIADRFGGHLPLIFAGVVMWGASIIIRNAFVVTKASTTMLVMYGIVATLGKMAFGFIDAPYNGMLPIIFHESEYGKVTGGLGLTLILGSAVGVSGSSLVYRYVGDWILSLLVTILLMGSFIYLIPVVNKSDKAFAYAKSMYYFSLDNKKRPNGALNQEIVDGFLSDEVEQDGEDIEFTKGKQQVTTDATAEKGNYSIFEDSDEEIYEDDDASPSDVSSNTPRRKRKRSSSSFRYLCCFGWLPDIIRPFLHLNYTLIVIVRVAMYMSVASTQTYALYFLEEMFNNQYSLFGFKFIETSKQAFAVFTLVVLCSSGLASIISGWLCDRYYEKRFYIFGSCIASALGLIIIVFTHNFTIMILCGFLGGIAVGTFIAVDLALANEVIPNKKDASKDLAIYAAARTVPLLIGTPLAGAFLQLGKYLVFHKIVNIRGFGYYIIYGISAFFCIISGVTVLFVNSKRTGREIHATLRLK